MADTINKSNELKGAQKAIADGSADTEQRIFVLQEKNKKIEENILFTQRTRAQIGDAMADRQIRAMTLEKAGNNALIETLVRQKSLEDSAEKARAKNNEKEQERLKKESEANEKALARDRKRQDALEEYNSAIDKTSYSLSKNLITEEDANKANLDAANNYIDALYKLGYASESEIGTIGYNALQSLIEKYPELIALTKEAKYETKQFGLGFEELAETERKLATAAVSMFTDASAAIATALVEGENGWSAFGKAGLNAIASLLDAIAIEIEALAVKEILLKGLFNPAGWAAASPFIAKGVAVSAAAGAVRGWAGTFETGGIVPGTSYTGDNMLASVNSGEMILNQQQQARLWNELSGLRNGGNSGNITVVSMLDGKKVSRSVTRRQRTNNA